jgi:hypothetical protein
LATEDFQKPFPKPAGFGKRLNFPKVQSLEVELPKTEVYGIITSTLWE